MFPSKSALENVTALLVCNERLTMSMGIEPGNKKSVTTDLQSPCISVENDMKTTSTKF